MKYEKKSLCFFCLVSFYIVILFVLGLFFNNQATVTNFSIKNLPPSFQYPFGTDWMGRNLFYRTLAGISLSLRIGLLSATVTGLFALFLAGISSLGTKMGRGVELIVDSLIGLPQILLMILISFALGKGQVGIIFAVASTHWPYLCKIIEEEIAETREKDFVAISKKLGKSRWYIFFREIFPSVVSQLFIGILLVFPQAILHESALSFLGFGIDNSVASIGIILAESMRHLMEGQIYSGIIPGLFLVTAILAFYYLGDKLRESFLSWG